MKRPAIVGLGIIVLLILAVAAITSAKTEKSEIAVKGMTCESCETSVTKALEKVEGIKSAKVNHKNGKAVVEFDSKKTDMTKIQAAIAKAGYKVEGKKVTGGCPASAGCASMGKAGGCCPSGKK